jgi:putative ABC transport system permease protein
MLARDLLRLSLHNLLLHKARSFLTSLGIIFGVGSVISMLAISEGAKEQALKQISSMGIDKIIVYSKKPSVFGTTETSSEQASVVKRYGLTEEDFKHVSRFDNIAGIVTLRDARKRFTKGIKNVDVRIVATEPAFLDAGKCVLVRGRWITSIDMKMKTSVCVIGKNVKRKLFSIGEGTVIGRKIPVEGKLFTVVGIVENNLGTQFPELKSPNDMILISRPASDALFGKNVFKFDATSFQDLRLDYDVLIIRVANVGFIDNTSKRIARYLEKTHEKKDWGIKIPLDLLKQKERTQNIFTIVMASIAGISLIVGGIGIMNIMLANVYERRKEIGTRRALGAKRGDILTQFLIETVFLTLTGGIIGIALGVGISELVTLYAHWPVRFSYGSVALSIVISAVVGIVFGTYPAWQAAKQNPIEALRTE